MSTTNKPVRRQITEAEFLLRCGLNTAVEADRRTYAMMQEEALAHVMRLQVSMANATAATAGATTTIAGNTSTTTVFDHLSETAFQQVVSNMLTTARPETRKVYHAMGPGMTLNNWCIRWLIFRASQILGNNNGPREVGGPSSSYMAAAK